MSAFLVSSRPTASLKPWHDGFHYSEEELRRAAQVIRESGFTVPVLVGKDGVVVAGYGQVEAARVMGLAEVPCTELEQMSEEGKRAYVVAGYAFALHAGWDEVLLAREVEGLFELGASPGVVGLARSQGSGTTLLAAIPAAGVLGDRPEDRLLDLEDEIVSRPGDLWCLGPHRLICSDASDGAAHSKLMADERAQMVFVDPHCDPQRSRLVSTAFLTALLSQLSAHSCEGSVHLVCAEWRYMRAVLEAGEAVYGDLKDLIVWIRHDGERSEIGPAHELVFVFENRTGIEDGVPRQDWCPRADIWRHEGLGRLHSDWTGDLVLQRTRKPVALLTEVIEQCTRPGDIVLDGFCDTGTMLIASEMTGRKARALEGHPASCDRSVRRWQLFTGGEALLAETGESFETVRQERRPSQDNGSAWPCDRRLSRSTSIC